MEKFIKINSSVNRFCEIEDFLNSIHSQFGLSRKLYCRIYIAIFEAINNAIQHGNRNDITKFVQIFFYDECNSYVFLVEDEGDGFDFNSVSDPTLFDNLRRESGRGIFFMMKYADEISFLNNGSCVKLIFYKTSD